MKRAKTKKKNKIKRYFKVFKRNLKSLTLKKALRWLKVNFKQHPFILALLFLIWLNVVFSREMRGVGFALRILKFHLFILGAWLALVILSNLLRDKDKAKIKWYFRKRFVFIMTLLLPPLGLVFLWAGSKFKRPTKITFTVVFGALFVINTVSSYRKYENFLGKSSLERTIEMITAQKRRVFLKKADKDILANLKLSVLSKRSKAKLAVSEIAQRCSSSVVSIKTSDKYGKEIGTASGFIISSDGIIITNFHVIESAYQAQVEISEDVFEEAYLVKAAPNLDIAILKIEAEKLPALFIGDSDRLVSGQFVIAMGNPWGFERSVSSGIVSALRSKGSIKLIQMTTPISPGSSGGPLINEYGEVVGITTVASIFMAQNLNFAIPISYLHKIIKEK